MAQLYFRYSTMNAGKSIDVLKTVHNYEEQNKKVLLYTWQGDNRYETGYVTSRMGIRKPANVFGERINLYEQISKEPVFCVVVDEAQFLKEEHVMQLTKVVDQLNIPVICYGLKNDFQNQLFEGSQALLRYADKIEEIKTVCTTEDCTRKATMVIRYKDHQPVFHGEQISVGGNDSYRSVCRKCYSKEYEKNLFHSCDSISV